MFLKIELNINIEIESDNFDKEDYELTSDDSQLEYRNDQIKQYLDNNIEDILKDNDLCKINVTKIDK